MSDSESTIYIIHGTTGQPVKAVLFEKISDKHIEDFENLWKPWLEAAMGANPNIPHPESSHWNWRRKMQAIGGLLAFPSFAIECGGETQGLMIANNTESCRLDIQKGKPLVYIEYLETAPWNRATLTAQPRYKRVGPALVDIAIQLSRHEEFGGRIGLHSLPQSDNWYRDKCGMIDLGKDPQKQNLHYFEMTTEKANLYSFI